MRVRSAFTHLSVRAMFTLGDFWLGFSTHCVIMHSLLDIYIVNIWWTQLSLFLQTTSVFVFSLFFWGGGSILFLTGIIYEQFSAPSQLMTTERWNCILSPFMVLQKLTAFLTRPAFKMSTSQYFTQCTAVYDIFCSSPKQPWSQRPNIIQTYYFRFNI